MRNRKKTIILLCVVIAALVIGMLAARANQNQNSLDTNEQKKIKEIKIPATAKQKKHSQLLRQSKGQKISELSAKGSGDIILTVEEPFVISPASKEQQPLPSIQTKVCNADAIVIGTLNDSSPQLTEDESFLFTEYTMAVEEVIKNNSDPAILQRGSISVVRDGGTGQFNGRTVRAKIEGFPPFTDGKRYILFLRFIPETVSYLAYAGGSFELKNNTIVPFGKLPGNISRERVAFISLTREAVATSDCDSQKEAQK